MRESTVALLGATAVLVLGAIDVADAGRALVAQWNVFLFFLGLMTTAAIADQSGLLEDLVVAAARAARGRADVLFLLVSAQTNWHWRGGEGPEPQHTLRTRSGGPADGKSNKRDHRGRTDSDELNRVNRSSRISPEPSSTLRWRMSSLSNPPTRQVG